MILPESCFQLTITLFLKVAGCMRCVKVGRVGQEATTCFIGCCGLETIKAPLSKWNFTKEL